jgi:enoyl-CoA hydratase/carnithine racemase
VSNVAEDLLFEVAEGVAVFTLNRPEHRNAFTDEMIRRWIDCLDECEARQDVRAILFAANGESFCAGADTARLAGNAEQTPLDAQSRMRGNAHALVRAVAACRKPIVAAVNGAAVGGGMDLALMCDVRIAAEKARFAETYAKMGLLPGVGGAWYLPRIIGSAAALDLFWSGRWVDAQEALRLGLVSRVLPNEGFAAAARDYAQTIADAAPLSVQGIKRLVCQGRGIGLDAHLDALAAELAVIRTSDDHKEAVAAFKDKRTPRFTGH